MNNESHIVRGIGSYVDILNNIRFKELNNAVQTILESEHSRIKDLVGRKINAVNIIEKTSVNISKLIESNRGGSTGMHGFIAERADVGIRNANRAFKGLQSSAILVDDNSAVDILLNNKAHQMKFYNNLTKELKVIAGYRDMDVIFPKDHYDLFEKVMNGTKQIEYNGGVLSENKIEQIKQLINEESKQRGVSYNEWMKPAKLTYSQSQRETINTTMDDHLDGILKQEKHEKKIIKKESNYKKIEAQQKAKASLKEASNAAVVGATFQGFSSFGVYVLKKRREGKQIWEFTSDEWFELGSEFTQGSIKGGFSGYTIYGFTNVVGLPAPLASAALTSCYGVMDAVMQLRFDEIDDNDFVDLVMFSSLDTVGSAIGAMIGQSIIPIPVVGSVIGSIAATTAIKLGKDFMGDRERDLLIQYQSRISSYVSQLDSEFKSEYDAITSTYNKISDFQSFTFDLDSNVELHFANSIELADFVGVDNDKILKNKREIDDFFLL